MTDMQQEVWLSYCDSGYKTSIQKPVPPSGVPVLGPYRAGQATGYAGSPYLEKRKSFY